MSRACRLVLLTALGSAISMAGCASRRASLPPPTAQEDSKDSKDAGARPEASKPKTEAVPRSGTTVPLQGLDRLYPSEEPQNRPGPGAPEAFPPRGTASRVAGEVAAGSKRDFSVQILASATREEAEARVRQFQWRFPERLRIDAEGGLYKIRIGRLSAREEAEELRRRAVDAGFQDAFVVKVSAPVDHGDNSRSEGGRQEAISSGPSGPRGAL